MQWTAKPSEIFIKKSNHDSIFVNEIPKYPRDMVWVFNLFQAIKRGLQNYLKIPAHDNIDTQNVFNKPIVKAHIYWIALLYYYQKKFSDINYATKLHKKASSTLVAEFEALYFKIILKTKSFYLEQSKNLEIEVSSTKLGTFFKNLCYEIGIDLEDGLKPFTENHINWVNYEEESFYDRANKIEI